MKHPITATDAVAEQAQGRIALWLDPDDLRWLVEYCGCPPDASQEQQDRCARIRFRANAALHKAGMSHNPWADTTDEEAACKP
jgi:hypothetical protein